MIDVRVGQGFDIHKFADAPIEGRVLILGGVPFPGERVLVGDRKSVV
jgi:2C-methyl-D-erythritol 2,4-cyclodiphosphate synthase